MPARKGEKRYRKTLSDLEKRRVGPGEEEEEAHTGAAAQEDAHSVSSVDEAPVPVQTAAPDDSQVFGAAVARVLRDGEGFLGGYSLKEQKHEERVKRRLEKKRVKRKRAFEVEGGQGYVSESSESEASEDESTKKRRIREKRDLKKHVLSQAHGREVPSLLRPDYEKSLRRVATKGVVRLFNAVTVAQKSSAPEPTSTSRDTETLGESLPKTKVHTVSQEEVTRSKFLDMLRKGGESKKHLVWKFN